MQHVFCDGCWRFLINTRAQSLTIALFPTHKHNDRSSHKHQIMEIQRLFGEHQSDPEQILSLLLGFFFFNSHSLINTRMRFVQHHTIVEFFSDDFDGAFSAEKHTTKN